MATLDQSELADLLGVVSSIMKDTGRHLYDVVDDNLVAQKLVDLGISPDRAEFIAETTYSAFDDLSAFESDNEGEDEEDEDGKFEEDDPLNELGLNEYNQLPSEVAEENRRQYIEDETDGNVDD